MITAAVAAGELPQAAGMASPQGTWRPPPGAAPGCDPSSLPFRLAVGSGRGASDIAALLAAGLRGCGWISDASVTGHGYLTVTVTPGALASLAVRVSQADPACARSDALGGQRVSAPPEANLATAATWAQAHERLTAAVSVRLAERSCRERLLTTRMRNGWSGPLQPGWRALARRGRRWRSPAPMPSATRWPGSRPARR